MTVEIASLTSRPSPAPTSATPPRRATRAVVRACSLLVLVLAGLLASAATASAHADLVASTPGDQEQLQQAPAEVTLTFSQPVGEQFASVTVTGPGGQTWQDGEAQVSGQSVVQPLRELTQAGSYRAQWRVVANDGHVLEGTVSFAYAPPQQEAAAAPAEEPLPGATEEPVAPVTEVDAQPAASTKDAGAGPDPVVIVAVLTAAAALLLGGAALVRRRARSSQPRG